MFIDDDGMNDDANTPAADGAAEEGSEMAEEGSTEEA